MFLKVYLLGMIIVDIIAIIHGFRCVFVIRSGLTIKDLISGIITTIYLSVLSWFTILVLSLLFIANNWGDTITNFFNKWYCAICDIIRRVGDFEIFKPKD